MDVSFTRHGGRTAILAALALVSLAVPHGEAAIYFRGKEAPNDGSAVAEFEKLHWVGDYPSQGTDRIMSHMLLRVNSPVSRVLIVMQVFDTKGEVVTSFSVSPKKCDEHPSVYWQKAGASAEGANRFPLCGVENPLVEVNPGNKRYESFKNGGIAWFYVDIKREKNVSSIRVVNVVVDGKEVKYGFKGSSNRLERRTQFQPAVMKHATEATLGSESTCRNWIPKDPAAAAKPGATYGGASFGNSTYGNSSTYGGNKPGGTYGGNTYGNSTYGGNTYGNNTYGGNAYGNSTYGGNTYGNNTYGGNKTGGNTYGNTAYGGNTYGSSTYGNQGAAQRQQPQKQQSWGSSGNYTLPEPVKFDLVPGRKVRIAEAQAGDIVILQYQDGSCGATMTHRKSPDEEDSRIRPLLFSEGAQEAGSIQGGSPGNGDAGGAAKKTSLTLDFGTKTKPQVIEVQKATTYWMELRESAMGLVTYKAWVIPARDKYRFYASPQGKQLKPQTNQGYQSY